MPSSLKKGWRSTLVRPAAGLALLMLCGAAFAHGSVETMGNFYGGLLHPLFVPAHWIAMLIAGLLVGQNGMHQNQPAMLCFVVFMVIGLALSGSVVWEHNELLLLIGALAAGLLVVIAARLRHWLLLPLAGFFALLIGMDSGPESITGGDRVVILAGTGLGVCLVFFYIVAITDLLKRPWQKIGVRVLGSWVTASAMIVLALLASGDMVDNAQPAPAADQTVSINQ